MPWAYSSSTDVLNSFRCHYLCICARTDRFVNIMISFQCGQKGTIAKCAAITGMRTCQNAWRMCLSRQRVNRPCFKYMVQCLLQEISYITKLYLKGWMDIDYIRYPSTTISVNFLTWLSWYGKHIFIYQCTGKSTSIDPLRMKYIEIFSSSLISQPILANQIMKYR